MPLRRRSGAPQLSSRQHAFRLFPLVSVIKRRKAQLRHPRPTRNNASKVPRFARCSEVPKSGLQGSHLEDGRRDEHLAANQNGPPDCVPVVLKSQRIPEITEAAV